MWAYGMNSDPIVMFFPLVHTYSKWVFVHTAATLQYVLTTMHSDWVSIDSSMLKSYTKLTSWVYYNEAEEYDVNPLAPMHSSPHPAFCPY